MSDNQSENFYGWVHRSPIVSEYVPPQMSWDFDGEKLNPSKQDALEKQVGGSHYKDLPIQPVEYIHANNIGYFEGCVIKYVSRWRNKNGIADLEKAKHYLELLIDLESKSKKESDGT